MASNINMTLNSEAQKSEISLQVEARP